MEEEEFKKLCPKLFAACSARKRDAKVFELYDGMIKYKAYEPLSHHEIGRLFEPIHVFLYLVPNISGKMPDYMRHNNDFMICLN